MLNLSRQYVPYGDRGIEVTLQAMQRLADRSRGNPDVIALAHHLVRGLPERDKDLEAATILGFVRDRLRYTDDPWDEKSGGKELVKDPALIVREIVAHGKYVGDCDDSTTLGLALLGAVGIPAEPVVIAVGPGSYSHVLLRYYTPGRPEGVTFDPIVRGTPLGWFPPGATRVGFLSGGRLVS